VGITLVLFIRRNNSDRKENLNIVKDNNMLNFYLSDDKFFSVDLEKNRKLNYTLIKAIREEVEFLKESVRRIDLINFEDKALEEKLNKMLKKAQQRS
jgi:regulator of PEP synthase PpsR (kinase-PPPase family)